VIARWSGWDDALDWLDAGRLNLIAVVGTAADTGRYEAALRLSLVMATYFDWRRRFDDLLATTTISLSAAPDDLAGTLGHCQSAAAGNLPFRVFGMAQRACADGKCFAGACV
jgi:hypothetical protein